MLQISSGNNKTIVISLLLTSRVVYLKKKCFYISTLTVFCLFQGQRFIGDLFPDGKIKSQETDIIFASPSAWAIHC